MKTVKRLFFVALFAIIFIIGTANASAEEQTYTVRIYSGNQGTINANALGNESAEPTLIYENTGIPYNSIFSFSNDYVTVPNGSKYKVRGIRESGRDNDTVSAPQFRVTKDVDYVVAYRVPTNEVTFQIRYRVSGSSTDIPGTSPTTHEGNVGETVMVAYPYIEGYTPATALNASWVLRDPAVYGSTVNDRIFYYTQNPTTPGGTVTTVTTAGGAVGGNANANANANTATANANANSITPNYTAPLETIENLDVPLAEFEGPQGPTEPVLVPFVDSSGEVAQRKLPNGLTIALIAVLAGLIAALYWYLLFYRKKKKYANEVDYDFSFLDEQDDHNDFR